MNIMWNYGQLRTKTHQTSSERREQTALVHVERFEVRLPFFVFRSDRRDINIHQSTNRMNHLPQTVFAFVPARFDGKAAEAIQHISKSLQFIKMFQSETNL